MRRFVKWPRYIRVQRQRRLLNQTIKVPAVISQLSTALDKNTNRSLFCLLYRYKNESKTFRRARQRKEAEMGVIHNKQTPLRITSVSFGINHVTRLVETKKAALVVIAGDVEPIEIVLWLPCLCQKMSVPYVIAKSKAHLGTVVNRKKVTSLAIKEINQNDEAELAKIVQSSIQYKTQNFKPNLEGIQIDEQMGQLFTKKKQNQIPGII
jgi:large subunit ribosomal protein L7Ae